MTGENVRQIPVQRDKRTMEERHTDMMSGLRNRFGRQTSAAKDSSMKQLEKPVHLHSVAPDWNTSLSRWVDDSFDWWNAEMRRLQNGMLSLVPMDLFGTTPHEIFTPYGDVRSVLDRMDRQARALTQYLDARQAAVTNGAHALVPQTEGGLLDYLKHVYQVGEDGNMHYKVRFNLQEYAPEDIKVTTSENGVNVHAKKVVETEHGSSTREYSRTIYLPPSVEKDKLECHLTEDGILTLEAPVKTPDYNSITFDRDRQLSIKPKSVAEMAQKQQTENTKAIQTTGVHGPTILKDDSGAQKLHVEIPVDPEFTADDLCVRMDANKVIVSGKKRVLDEQDHSKCTYIKEFSRLYDVPETVDLFSVDAQLHNGKLLVEAPLLHGASSK